MTLGMDCGASILFSVRGLFLLLLLFSLSVVLLVVVVAHPNLMESPPLSTIKVRTGGGSVADGGGVLVVRDDDVWMEAVVVVALRPRLVVPLFLAVLPLVAALFLACLAAVVLDVVMILVTGNCKRYDCRYVREGADCSCQMDIVDCCENGNLLNGLSD